MKLSFDCINIKLDLHFTTENGLQFVGLRIIAAKTSQQVNLIKLYLDKCSDCIERGAGDP